MRDLKEAVVKAASQTQVNLRKAYTEGKLPPTSETQSPFRNP